MFCLLKMTCIFRKKSSYPSVRKLINCSLWSILITNFFLFELSSGLWCPGLHLGPRALRHEGLFCSHCALSWLLIQFESLLLAFCCQGNSYTDISLLIPCSEAKCFLSFDRGKNISVLWLICVKSKSLPETTENKPTCFHADLCFKTELALKVVIEKITAVWFCG